MGFDFHWFKLCLIAVVILWVTHSCHVYSSCLSFFVFFFSFPKWCCVCQGVFCFCFFLQREDSTGSAVCASTHVSGLCVCVCVLAHPSLMAREVFDPLRGGQAGGLQSVKQIRLSLLRLVTYYSPA